MRNTQKAPNHAKWWAVACVFALSLNSVSHAFAQAVTTGNNSRKMPWLNAELKPEERANLLLAKMSLTQKISLLHANATTLETDAQLMLDSRTSAIPQLRVPSLLMADALEVKEKTVRTSLPAPIAQAASFDPGLARKYGELIGQEVKNQGKDLVFGPGFNLARNPQAGRNYEYFGEDPYLAGTIAAANVKGVQSQGIMAVIKHYVANNQVTNQSQSTSKIDARTLREIYEKPFQIAIQDAKPAGVMCSRNKINNVHSCSSQETLNHDLRKRMGFNGMVLSDYLAAAAPKDLANGLNLELPNALITAEPKIRQALKTGEITGKDINNRLRQTLTQMFRFGLFDHPWDEKNKDRKREIKEVNSKHGEAVALETALKGAVLLKNDGILPLNKDNPPKRVLIIGQSAQTPLGIKNGKSIPHASPLESIKTRIKSAQVEYLPETNQSAIATKAAQADLVIVFVSDDKIKTRDRADLELTSLANQSVSTAAKHNPNTLVVTQIGGPVLMPWIEQTRAVLNVWYPGQAAGEAIARLLFGEYNPSGRLPQTFPANTKQVPAQNKDQFPGAKLGFESIYSEGLKIGYRWYSTMKQKPLFSFGYGLSYTNFTYGKSEIIPASQALKVKISVTNSGPRNGMLTPQIYVRKPGAQSPAKELVAFTKLELKPGQTQEITLSIPGRELETWNTKTDRFEVSPGKYEIYVGDNVNDTQFAGVYENPEQSARNSAKKSKSIIYTENL
ncbi:glycoside hydrolase family 3 C-terminal domain-containing protein [Actinomycetaceae bacterium TAE3-ERU4]|nr:glycoside hydrolase family 3 C-terminal domain-containing protein [Actinomycetaceae bacterium TAE3-ERU4]